MDTTNYADSRTLHFLSVSMDARKVCLCMDARKVLFLNVCYSNSNPLLIGGMYLKFLFDTEMVPVNLRMDRGTEICKLATIHVYLLNQHGLMDDPTDSIIYGPSTSNRIERWWRNLHERLEAFFKERLTVLLRRREYDPLNSTDRQLLAHVFIPIVQKECDIFVKYWNSHRNRGQDKVELLTGVPKHVFLPRAIRRKEYGNYVEQGSAYRSF